jgi:heterogeneous nuclear ribonucleoprotein U-like protein 1
VPGLLRKNNYGERFERLMDYATWIFNKLLTRAANTPRNFIIDQTNVYKNARIRKLRPFANYRKVSCKREKGNDRFPVW